MNMEEEITSKIKIEDITSDEDNQEILRRIKDNDPSFHTLRICNQDEIEDEFDFWPINGEKLGWLGWFLGKNTTLNKLFIVAAISPACNAGVEVFRKGLARNNSIRSVTFCCHRLDGQVFRMFGDFFKNNDNLTEFEVRACELGAEDVRQLSLALGQCNTSLKQISFAENEIEDGQLSDIIAALSMHPQLEHIDLNHTEIGRIECTAVADLLRNTTKQLQTLNLYGNNIDDEGIESLVHAISGSQLVKLILSRNRSITVRGWKRVSTLLEMPDSKLEVIDLCWNNLGDEGALIFANALRGNSKLKLLSVKYGNGITAKGWAHFSTLLCDTSSINKTYLSNHTLEHLGGTFIVRVPADIDSYLALNGRSESKGQIAMTKILKHHSHFNVQPFFEWEFKVLPLMITWLEKARARTSDFEEKIKRTKLSIAYDFVREFPMLYIEPVTRQEIEDCSALEKKLQGDKCQQAKLEEVQQRKECAMRRLL